MCWVAQPAPWRQHFVPPVPRPILHPVSCNRIPPRSHLELTRANSSYLEFAFFRPGEMSHFAHSLPWRLTQQSRASTLRSEIAPEDGRHQAATAATLHYCNPALCLPLCPALCRSRCPSILHSPATARIRPVGGGRSWRVVEGAGG